MARLLDLVRVTRDFNRKEQIPPERTADAARVLKVTWEGDDEAGYRVEIADDGMDDSTWYVVREAGEYRILAEGPLLANLGGEALERVAAGDLPGARRWLGWTWDVQKDDVGWFNAFSGTPFARIWWTADHDDRFAVRLAAAALLAEGRDTAQAIPILLEVRENEGEERQQLQADRALARAFRNAGRPEKLLETAERVLAQSRTALEGLEHKVAALWQLGRKDELGGFLRSQLERTDLGHQTEEMLAIRAGQMGLFALSQEHLRPLVDRGRASPLSYNELAWNALFTRGAD